jgi:23S rRNA pseudouridine1911/1915/1917 synthase
LGKEIRILVGPEGDGKALREILRAAAVSSSALQRAKKAERGILLDGRPVFVSAIAREGQTVILKQPERAEQSLLPVQGELRIAYEDEDLLVLNKPPRLSAHPGPGNKSESLANFVAAYLQARGEAPVFRGVNRLDRTTSGLLAAAKHAHAQHFLAAQLRDGRFKRRYLGLFCGEPGFDEREIDAPIARKPGSALAREVREGGAPAKTRLRVLRRGEGLHLGLFELESGRTHQIRVHMAHLGLPLLGDFLYGQEIEGQRCMLHAALLRCERLSGGELRLFSPPPEDFCRVAGKMGIEIGSWMEEELWRPL